MKTLEATVEIVKAPTGNEKDSTYLISSEEYRENFLTGIEELHKNCLNLNNKKKIKRIALAPNFHLAIVKGRIRLYIHYFASFYFLKILSKVTAL